MTAMLQRLNAKDPLGAIERALQDDGGVIVEGFLAPDVVHISYVLGWLRTEENNHRAVPPELARALARAAQEVLGYAVHDAIASTGGYLGRVGLRDPVELMREGKL